MADIPHIPASWGEVIDKITILEIKVSRLPTDVGRTNAAKELRLLNQIAASPLADPPIATLAARLKMLNEALWDVEDRIRDHERMADFGAAFVELARAVYRHNDARSALKREINLALGSALIEEKSYHRCQ
ncbi:MAG TPA: DUF6165 family protein [Rhizomicrobium sp.]|nr:DUF6165 family protein [Rhizomicrobium sp.]